MKKKPMRCAAIHDLSGLGKCSLTVALPVLSVCGVETSVLPTAVLSTHTGGFQDYVFVDLTRELLPIAEHWHRVGAAFEAVYTGFLGNARQIALVDRILGDFRAQGSLAVVDPVMGDNGRLYPTYTEEMAAGVAALCQRADVLIPNMTEAARILGLPYRKGPYSADDIREILRKLCRLGDPEGRRKRKTVLTGIDLGPGQLGVACRDEGSGRTAFFMEERVPGDFHGTGDFFASVLTGGLLNGMDLFQAAQTATHATWRVIVSTAASASDLRFGPKFEEHLPWLGILMENYRKNLAKSADLG